MRKIEWDIHLLNQSIDVWEELLITPEKEHGRSNCPLCMEYNNKSDSRWSTSCNGCPIKMKTKYRHCNETPYYSYLYTKRGSGLGETLQSAIKRELEFLKSVRRDLKRRLSPNQEKEPRDG